MPMPALDPLVLSFAVARGIGLSAGKITAEDAAAPILIALSVNTVTKSSLCFSAGSRGFALAVVPGLILVFLAAWLGWWMA
jgi:uncharacterized membrane protein (DUF4010 family)